MATVHVISLVFVMSAGIQNSIWAFHSLSDGFEIDEANDNEKLLIALRNSDRIE